MDASEQQDKNASDDGDAEREVLDFASWSGVSARVGGLDRSARLDVLERFEIALDLWERSDARWTSVIAEDAASGKLERPLGYGRLCSDELKRREMGGPDPVLPVRRMRDGSDRDGPTSVPKPRSPSKTERPEAGAGLSVRTEVVAVPPHVPSYLKDAAPNAPAPSPPHVSSRVLDTSTMEVAAVPGNPLPFRRDPTLDVMARLPAIDPAPRLHATAGETLEVDAAVLIEKFPFAMKAAAAAGAAPSGADAARAAPAAATRLPPLTLSQYAALCVDVQTRPTELAATLARYHLTSETRARLDAHMQARLVADTDLRAAFDEACVTYRATLSAGAPRR